MTTDLPIEDYDTVDILGSLVLAENLIRAGARDRIG
jgi:hypothetical protein